MPAPILRVVLCATESDALVERELLRKKGNEVTGPERLSEANWQNKLDSENCEAFEGDGKELWAVFARKE